MTTLIVSALWMVVGVPTVLLFSSFMAAFFVNRDPFERITSERKQRLVALLENNHVPWEVQKSVMAIYPSLLATSVKDYSDLLQELPPFMAEQIHTYIKIRLLKSVPMFMKASQQCLEALAGSLIHEMQPPQTYIMNCGDVAKAMYFLNHGVVEILAVNGETGEETSIKTLKDGSWFGEIALLMETRRTASVRSVTAVDMFRIERDDFNQVLLHYSELSEIIQAEAAKRFQQITQTQQQRKSVAKPASDEEQKSQRDGHTVADLPLAHSGHLGKRGSLAQDDGHLMPGAVSPQRSSSWDSSTHSEHFGPNDECGGQTPRRLIVPNASLRRGSTDTVKSHLTRRASAAPIAGGTADVDAFPLSAVVSNGWHAD